MSEFSEADVQGKAGREALAIASLDGINGKLVDLEDFAVYKRCISPHLYYNRHKYS